MRWTEVIIISILSSIGAILGFITAPHIFKLLGLQ